MLKSGKVTAIAIWLLWSCRTDVRVQFRTGERNAFQTFRFWPVLFLHFQFVSLMSKFANSFFSAWLYS